VSTSFQRHGIEHLSVSAINVFAAQPALFVMERLMKRRGPVGAAAHRGTAAESGIVMGLLDPIAKIEDCQDHAVKEFDRLTALSGDPKRDKEREAVPKIVQQGIEELRPYGVPTGVQVRIERTLPGLDIPWLGFADLVWDAHAITFDIKTSLKLSSDITATHARQVALYTFGTNNEARVGYFTPAKRGVYRLSDAEQRIGELVNLARRLERFLSVSDDPAVLAGMVVPDVDSFWYSDATTRSNAREVYGL
jgi:hypothetical protein